MARPTQKNRRIAVTTSLPDDDLLLVSLFGHEELSRPFLYRLEMLSTEDSISARDMVGKSIDFLVKRSDNQPRYFNGFVRSFVAGTREEGGFRRYTAEAVPWLWFLTRTTDCRIFQNQTVPDILRKVFEDMGFKQFSMAELKAQYREREYCVQYRESDFDFVSRLMEEEGIFYHFEHNCGQHTMILADQTGAYKDLPENEVEYEFFFGPLIGKDRLTSWEHQYEFISGAWAQTDYDFKNPARAEPTPSSILEVKQPTKIDLEAIKKYELYDYPGRFRTRDHGRELTKVRMEEEEAAHEVVRARSTCRTFNPAGRFTVKKHDAGCEVGRSFVVTSIQHEAVEPADYFTKGGWKHSGAASGPCDYRNTFTCIPDSVIFRPRRTTPKPIVYGVQTAVVTGPKGAEIHTDPHGRVQVQFFWDREGKRVADTSCWIRCMQPSAGKGWGMMSVPRIGQEVVVTFLEGDPDRPLIAGCVYNADQLPGYNLPDEKTKTYLKTNSSPGGEGFNELRFEDKKGEEQVFLHAERDLDIRVKNDKREDVVHHEHHTVGGEKREVVHGDVMETFRQNHSERVTKESWLHAKRVVIQADEEISLVVGGNFIKIFAGGIHIEGTMTEVNCSNKVPTTDPPTKHTLANGSDKGRSGVKSTPF